MEEVRDTVGLFRHPLGIPIPHTAIVASSKERIGIAIGRFTANNFLSPKVLAERMRDADISGWAARWILRGDNAKNVAQRVTSSLNQALGALPREDLNAFLSPSVVNERLTQEVTRIGDRVRVLAINAQLIVQDPRQQGHRIAGLA